MSDVIQRLPPKMCPFCELLGSSEPLAITNTRVTIAGIPSCVGCAMSVQSWSQEAQSGLLKVLDALQYLRSHGYTVERDSSNHWRLQTGDLDQYWREADLIRIAKLLRLLEQRAKQEASQ